MLKEVVESNKEIDEAFGDCFGNKDEQRSSKKKP
jgi:hypothetical protein